jgi:predicted unusual protein kinase regulating ubiquinone biosynthesis (AarF/ABC1/UbiB family)
MTSTMNPASTQHDSSGKTIEARAVVVNELPSSGTKGTSPSVLPSDFDMDAWEATPSPPYDPEAIEATYQGRWWTVLKRAITVLWPCLIFAFGVWRDRQSQQIKQNAPRRAQQLRELLTRLGPAFIKVGQALSTRPDLVPSVYLEELTKLQDQLPPFPNEIAYQFIEEELGDRPENCFAELSDKPVAAASLGQVYKGKLKTGEVVAVKVQRPGLTEQITLDIYIMRSLAKWAVTNIKRIRSNLVAITDEFAGRIFEEMDYSQEGRNAEQFARLYGSMPEIYVPKIYWQYTGKRVLTMEWITGTKLTNLEAVAAQGIDATHLVDVGVQCSLRQLLEHGFFHADPHPGNLLAMPNGKLAYLDFGMMSRVKKYQRYGLIEAVVHMVNRDFARLAEDYVKLEFLTPDTNLEPIAGALAGVFNNALGSSVSELNFKNITDQLSEVMYEFPFQVPAYYALIIRSLVTLEGIAINVDPDFKVLSKAYPYIAKRLLTDPSPELRASLQDLLFREGEFRWNRLENLLKNAKDSLDYDLNEGIDRAAEFLLSERGEFIRQELAMRLVEAIDGAGQTAWQSLTQTWDKVINRGRTPSPATPSTRPGMPASKPATDPRETLTRLQRIWALLQDTPGFDSVKLLQLAAKILVRPETQQFGQQVAGELAQRAIARLIREVLMAQSPPTATSQPQGKALPIASLR